MVKLAPFIALGAIVAVLQGVPARAQNAKSWVADFGSDASSCTIGAPCATLQRAFNQTNSGGEIGMLTPGDYGGGGSPRLNITRSIAITNDGIGEAGVLVTGGVVGIGVAAGA